MIKLRRDTAANWTSVNPVLGDGQPGFETDTGYLKVGDGVTAWNSLTYVIGAILLGDRWVLGEVPAGAIDGMNKVFTTAMDMDQQTVYNRGQKIFKTYYSQTDTNEITFVTAPEVGDTLEIDYTKA